MIGRPKSQDDWLHPPTGAANWRESLFFGFHDGSGRAGLTYVSLNPHQGIVERIILLLLPEEGRTLAWMRQEPLHHFADAALAEGGLQYHCRVPLEWWQLRAGASCLSIPQAQELSSALAAARASPVPVERMPIAFDLRFEARMPAYGYPAGAWDFLGSGQEHFEQVGQVAGWLYLREQQFPITGLSSRDRSWGPRDWLCYEWYQWLSLQFGDDFFVGAALGRANGQEIGSGFVYRDGAVQPIVQVDVQAERDADNLHLLAGTAEIVTGPGQILSVELIPASFLHTVVARGEGRQSHDAYTVVLCRCAGRTGRGFVEYARKEPIPEDTPVPAGLW